MPPPGLDTISTLRVRDLLRSPAVTCVAAATSAEIARVMMQASVGSVIVVDDSGAPCGVVTDRDLRAKVLAGDRSPSGTTAAEIMSSPVATIDPGAFAFQALLEMTRRKIHHLPVLEDGRLVGVVSSHDLVDAQAVHPILLIREIMEASSADVLATLASRVTALVGRLVDAGAAAADVGHLVAELNDHMVRRVLELTAARLAAIGEAAPPVHWCWLLLGSEARREQTLRTDQDNAFVYADPPPELAETAARYFRRFSEEAIRGLMQIGFPPCPGGTMASNPRWCQPLAVWIDYFRGWMTSSSPASVLDASIYFDLRALAGDDDLAGVLTGVIRSEAPEQRRFLSVVARDVVERGVPLTIFGNVRVHRGGPHRGRVDVKGAGTIQVVGAARLHALALGLAETNTIERFRAAAERGAFSADLVGEVIDAYQHLMRLRLRHQLAQLAHGQVPDNLVARDSLSHGDALLFREALHTVRRLQAFVRERFATDFVP